MAVYSKETVLSFVPSQVIARLGEPFNQVTAKAIKAIGNGLPDRTLPRPISGESVLAASQNRDVYYFVHAGNINKDPKVRAQWFYHPSQDLKGRLVIFGRLIWL